MEPDAGPASVPVPVFSGTTGSWREFERRVKAWKLATNIAVERQGPAMYACLQGEAWQAVEDLDPQLLAGDDVTCS